MEHVCRLKCGFRSPDHSGHTGHPSSPHLPAVHGHHYGASFIYSFHAFSKCAETRVHAEVWPGKGTRSASPVSRLSGCQEHSCALLGSRGPSTCTCMGLRAAAAPKGYRGCGGRKPRTVPQALRLLPPPHPPSGLFCVVRSPAPLPQRTSLPPAVLGLRLALPLPIEGCQVVLLPARGTPSLCRPRALVP